MESHTLPVAQLRDHYTQMLRIRAFEETAMRGLRAGAAHGALHPCIGQEAVAVGLLSQTRTDDLVLSTHRGHGHTLAKGASPAAMLKELFGRAGGTSGGRGGSMHIADFSVGMLGANGVVSANIIIAAGAAHGLKMQGGDRIAVCFMGDGAINRGPFLEGLNWAAVYGLPVLFVCEDNQIAAMTDTKSMTAGPGPVARAEALGVPAETVDGNDIEAVAAVATRLISGVRAGEGPAFLHAKTFRLLGHTATDKALQREQSQVEAAWEVEPIARTRALLLERGSSEADLAQIDAAVQDEMDEVYREAAAAPLPDPAEAYREVQTVGSPEREAF